MKRFRGLVVGVAVGVTWMLCKWAGMRPDETVIAITVAFVVTVLITLLISDD